MSWFKRKSKNGDQTLKSPANGEVTPITEVPDEVFATKMMGDGFAVKPENGKVVSPVSGKVTFIADTKHGIGLTADNGMEIIIHMGIDTVSLKGKPFQMTVGLNEIIHAGDQLVTIDLNVIKAADLDPVIIVAITNFNDLAEKLEVNLGSANAGDSVAKLV
ncbi:PTS glucose transporter subunit IIA [Pediococcus siamensis]|uniref:PTS sugar transporter subunit IIA n=1 Tax=Pediococcus siamensis TaxID=381829 RepID=UPI00399EFB1A